MDEQPHQRSLILRTLPASTVADDPFAEVTI